MFFEDHASVDKGKQGFSSLGQDNLQVSREDQNGKEERGGFVDEEETDHSFSLTSFTADSDGVDPVDWSEQLQQLTRTERQCPDILPYPERFMHYATRRLAQREKEIKELIEKEKAATEAEDGLHRLLPFHPSDVMELEVQRVRFFITEFLRCRLRKIEALCTRLYYEGMIDLHEQRRQEGSTKRKPTGEVEDATGSTEDGEGSIFQQNEDTYSTALEPISFPLRKHLSKDEIIVADRLSLAMEKTVRGAGMNLLPESLQRLIPQRPYGEGLEILPSPQHETFVFAKAATDLGVVPFGEGADQEIRKDDLFLAPYYTFRPHVLDGSVSLL